MRHQPHNFMGTLIWDAVRLPYAISQSIGSTGVSPVQAQAKACGYHKLLFDCNSV